MAKLELGTLTSTPQECVEFIHANHPGLKVLSSIKNPKLFWHSDRKYVEGLEGALLFSPATTIVAAGTYLVPAVIAAAAFFKGITALELSAEMHSIIAIKHTVNGVRYYCGNNAVLLGMETNGELEIMKSTPVVVESYIRQLFMSQRSQVAAVA